MGGRLNPEAQKKVENIQAMLASDEFAEMSPQEKYQAFLALGAVSTHPESLTSRVARGEVALPD